MSTDELVNLALKARTKAYAPYSNFLVGAALLAADGQVFLGCNVESASYTPTNCAERTAFFKAISEGVRTFRAIAIVGAKDGAPVTHCFPCGVCRQVMAEFCESDFKVIIGDESGNHIETTLDAVLPHRFGPSDLL